MARIREWQLQTAQHALRLRNAVERLLQASDSRLELAARTLHGVSPLATLARGFAIVTRVANGAVLRSTAGAAVGDEIDARLANGSLRARVTGHA